MKRMSLELDTELYWRLKRAASAHHLTVEQECLRRLESGERPSRYMQALLAELRADEEQRRVDEQVG